jgi:hypothetical protein
MPQLPGIAEESKRTAITGGRSCIPDGMPPSVRQRISRPKAYDRSVFHVADQFADGCSIVIDYQNCLRGLN